MKRSLFAAALILVARVAFPQNLALQGGNDLRSSPEAMTIHAPEAIGVLGTGYRDDGGWCGGPYINLTAAAGSAVTITGFEMYFKGTVNRDVEVYWRPGSYVGSETVPEEWTLLGTVNVNPSGTGTPTAVGIGGLTIPAGHTYGIKVWDGGTGGPDGPGLDIRAAGTFASDTNLSLGSNRYTCSTTWSPLNPQQGGWQGNVLYTTVSLQNQSLNIDLGTHFGSPADSYGASGQTGRWNEIGLGATSGLLNTASASTPVSVFVTAQTELGWLGGCTDPDAEPLVGDNIYTYLGMWEVTLSGLANGIYEAHLYAPNNGSVATGNMMINGIAVTSTPGSGSCDLTPGTGSVHVWIEVINGTILMMGDPAGSGFDYAGLAGLQLVGPVDPEILSDGFESGDTSAWSSTVQ